MSEYIETFGEFCQALYDSKKLEFLVKNCWNEFKGDADIGNLKLNFESTKYRYKKQKKKLYKWAYKDNNNNWFETKEYYDNELCKHEFVKFDDDIISKDFKRLDYTMIEVEE